MYLIDWDDDMWLGRGITEKAVLDAHAGLRDPQPAWDPDDFYFVLLDAQDHVLAHMRFGWMTRERAKLGLLRLSTRQRYIPVATRKRLLWFMYGELCLRWPARLYLPPREATRLGAPTQWLKTAEHCDRWLQEIESEWGFTRIEVEPYALVGARPPYVLPLKTFVNFDVWEFDPPPAPAACRSTEAPGRGEVGPAVKPLSR